MTEHEYLAEVIGLTNDAICRAVRFDKLGQRQAIEGFQQIIFKARKQSDWTYEQVYNCACNFKRLLMDMDEELYEVTLVSLNVIIEATKLRGTE